MSKELPWLERIKKGTKTIESRWYRQRRRPWQSIEAGDHIFFKNSGEPVCVVSRAARVLFYNDLTPTLVGDLLDRYAESLGIKETEKQTFFKKVAGRQFCILIFLEDVAEIDPFSIDKKGFGTMVSWITTPNVYLLKKR